MNSHEQFTRQWTDAQPIVASYLATLLPDFRDAEDLLQNVAIACLRKFQDYDPERPFVAWALGMARLEALNLRRAHARSRIVFDESMLGDLAEVCEELSPEFERRARALRCCLDRLGQRASELVRLRYEQSLEMSDIASHARMAVVAVRVMLSRTRAALRACIERQLKLEDASR